MFVKMPVLQLPSSGGAVHLLICQIHLTYGPSRTEAEHHQPRFGEVIRGFSEVHRPGVQVDLHHEPRGQHLHTQRIACPDSTVRTGAPPDWHVHASGVAAGVDGPRHGHGDEIVPLHRHVQGGRGRLHRIWTQPIRL